MTWNYRIIKNNTDENPDCHCFVIYEVYYDVDGSITAITEDPSAPFGDTFKELKRDLAHMKKAFREPVLLLSELNKTLLKKRYYNEKI
jgi:hypothetical protein